MKNQNEKPFLPTKKLLKDLQKLYSKSEIEETIFNVFEEANLYADFTYEEKEKRKLIHETLRKVFRNINSKII